ncbi:hypothetical protein GTZ78_33260 [Streptomyces sp. SID8361]|uniref:hypothetical protein n=1 Tax=Streptomyces sp. MnatMP-M27 TaxID=1839768 RepID=UPI00081F5C8F|nr:hypothetical protein [Streptomyces sp. MnatMP-M27]MYU15424.1 hypothetical protein [Streptomyces sp. SID8361]SCG09415.1 hypothetical protein GA0115260_109963 [Streptomyces sp. MnatMP-M27]
MTKWEIWPVPGRGLYRMADGELALPLRISSDGRHRAITQLTLTSAEAEQLHAALCYALGEQPPPAAAPECRRPVRYPSGRQRY